MSIKNPIKFLKKRVFPSQHYLAVKKWREDNGDYILRFDYELGSDSLVLDVGGYEGQWASDLFSRYQCFISIFEPVNTFFARINERFVKNDKIRVYPFGLGGASRCDKIHVSADGSSIFGKSNFLEKINIVDVKGWIDNNIIPCNYEIDLMKINIEGGEYELLDRLIETHTIDIIKNIQVQFHEISMESQAHMKRIQTELIKTHELTYQYRFVWENWKRKNARS